MGASLTDLERLWYLGYLGLTEAQLSSNDLATLVYQTPFAEAARDVLGAALVAGANVTVTVDDAANTITIAATSSGLNAEQVSDLIIAQVQGTGLITATPDDALDKVTISTTATLNATDAALRDRSTHTGTQLAATVSDFLEAVLDGLAIPLRGTGLVTVTHNDALDTITVSTTATLNDTDANLKARANHTGTQLSATISDFAEAVQDVMGVALVAGANVTITYDDAANTITIASSAGGGVSDGDKGDITVSGGGVTWTIDANVVTYAKMQDVSATSRIMGRITAAAGDMEELTGAQVTTLLDVFTSTLKGLVPLSGGGTVNFLRADGTWVVPPGDAETIRDVMGVALIAGDGQKIVVDDPLNTITHITDFVKGNAIRKEFFSVMPKVNGTVPDVHGVIAATATGTATAANKTITSRQTRAARIDYLVTAAAIDAIAGVRIANDMVVRGNAAGIGGFYVCLEGGQSTGGANTTSRFFMGISAVSAAPTSVEPSTLINCLGLGYDSADANYQIMHNDGAGACVKINTGWAVPTTDREDWMRIEFSCDPNATSITYTATRMDDGAVLTGTISTDMPVNTSYLSPRIWASSGATSAVVGVAFGGFFLSNKEWDVL